ncbi:hypothetical protein Q1695_009345 [Nippostrongylus brasiliensis]|nr:hypothetical protein Q1695_009345 [Nippostrongylus brasiliensis]
MHGDQHDITAQQESKWTTRVGGVSTEVVVDPSSLSSVRGGRRSPCGLALGRPPLPVCGCCLTDPHRSHGHRHHHSQPTKSGSHA